MNGHLEDHPDSPEPARSLIGPVVSWEDIGVFGLALTMAMRKWRLGIQSLRDEYSLGPRGPWVLGVISRQGVINPKDLTDAVFCTKSQITSELIRLTEAGLVTSSRGKTDRRQVELSLTALGETVNARLANSFVTIFEEQLPGYSREDVLFCAGLLKCLAGPLDLSVPEEG